ncbi:Derlin like protein [Aduncisulcus paluster]|uniref:Derlin n=1 Tax=Aduncisulcus paluster TaxID=2918883 RepID=A0ABQ5KT51_9EUKA|nr:Derlin like protein [Aduncisulcus paluster]
MFYFDVFEPLILYVWSKLRPNVLLALLGILTFPATALPYVNIILNLVSGKAILPLIIGDVLGHLYFLSEFVFPRLFKLPSEPINEAEDEAENEASEYEEEEEEVEIQGGHVTGSTVSHPDISAPLSNSREHEHREQRVKLEQKGLIGVRSLSDPIDTSLVGGGDLYSSRSDVAPNMDDLGEDIEIESDESEDIMDVGDSNAKPDDVPIHIDVVSGHHPADPSRTSAVQDDSRHPREADTITPSSRPDMILDDDDGIDDMEDISISHTREAPRGFFKTIIDRFTQNTSSSSSSSSSSSTMTYGSSGSPVAFKGGSHVVVNERKVLDTIVRDSMKEHELDDVDDGDRQGDLDDLGVKPISSTHSEDEMRKITVSIPQEGGEKGPQRVLSFEDDEMFVSGRESAAMSATTSMAESDSKYFKRREQSKDTTEDEIERM